MNFFLQPTSRFYFAMLDIFCQELSCSFFLDFYFFRRNPLEDEGWGFLIEGTDLKLLRDSFDRLCHLVTLLSISRVGIYPMGIMTD